MKTLEQHNEDRREADERRRKSMQPHANGIACPGTNCGGELWDSSPGFVLTSNPPQKNVHCPKCGYHGFALL